MATPNAIRTDGEALGPLPPPPRLPRSLLRLPRITISSRMITGTLIVVLVIYLVLVPIGYLLDGTFVQDGHFSLSLIRQAYSAPGLGKMVLNSFEFAIGATVLALVIGTALAYLVARTDVPFKGLVYLAAIVPMIIPGVLNTIAWIFLASPQIGALYKAITPIHGIGFFNVFSIQGMIFVEGIHAAPLAFLLLYAAFRNMDSSLEESALMSGAPMWKVFFKVTLPMVRPALLLTTIILVIRTLASFEVPQLLGAPSRIFVFTSQIYNALRGFPVNYGLAGSYSIGLLVILGALSLLQTRATKRSRSYQTITGKAFRPSAVHLGWLRMPAGILVGLYFIVACVLPLLILVYASLLGFYSAPSRDTFKQLSFENYRTVFSDPSTVTAFKNSLILAVGCATVIMIVTAVLAWLVVRQKIRGGGAMQTLAMTPVGIPGLVIGVSLLFLYLRVSLPIYGTLLILLIAYVTIFLPYGVTYASSAMYQISDELEESAQVSGAGFLRVFRAVTFPLLMPGLLAGWTFILLLSIRELGASLLLYTPGQQVLPVQIWNLWGDGNLTELAALGVIMIAMLMLLTIIARRLGANIGVRTK